MDFSTFEKARSNFYKNYYNVFSFGQNDFNKLQNLEKIVEEKLMNKQPPVIDPWECRLFVGIDPGYSGAIAVLDDSGEFLEIFDMPVCHKVYQRKRKVKENDTRKRRKILAKDYDIFSINYMLQKFLTTQHTICVGIERVPPRIGRALTMGDVRIYAGWKMWHLGLLAYDFDFENVSPCVWRRHFGIPKRIKELSLHKARNLYPSCPYLGRQKDHNRAEAILVARWMFDFVKDSKNKKKE